jgi:hypothetical protein
MLAGSSQPEVTDVTHHIASLYSEENNACGEKLNAARKYQRKMREKRKKAKLLAVAKQEYDELVHDIQRLRLKKKDPTIEVRRLEKNKKKQKKLSKIAVVQSPPTLKSMGCALLDGLQAVINYLKAARDVVGEDVLKFLIDLFTTLYNIWKSPEWDTLLLNMASFFSRHFPTQYADYALCWMRVAFEVAFTQDDNKKSYKELILGFFTNSVEFLDDKLWANICNFFVKISALYACVSDAVSLEALDLDTVLKQFEIFKSQLPEVKDIIEMVFLCYEFVLGNWAKIRTGDWSVLLLGKDETQEFEMEVRILEQAFPFVISNKEIELKDRFNLTKGQFDSRLQSAIKKAKSLINRCTNTQQKMAVSNFIKSLTDKQAQLYATVAEAPRKLEAYGIKFSGPSGTGKSTLLDMCSRVILRAYNHDPRERGQVVFTNISETFESTIYPTHKIICADDVANNKNEKPNYDRMLNYINTVSRPLLKADVKEKGIYYPGNDALMVTTNDETIRAVECSSCPESILRRFTLDVTVEIRPQFRNAYGGLQRFDKPRYDVYSLTLKRFSHIEETPSGEKIICWDVIPRREWNPFEDDDHDFAAMCTFLAKDVKRHVKLQHEIERAQKELDECEYCPDCGCPSMVCFCNESLECESCGKFPCECIPEDLDETDVEEVTSDITPLIGESIEEEKPERQTCPCCDEKHCECDEYDDRHGNHEWCTHCPKSSENDETNSVPHLEAFCACCDANPCACEMTNEICGNHLWCDQCHPVTNNSLDELLSVDSAVTQLGSPWSAFSTAELWDYRAAVGGCTDSLRNIYRTGALYAKAWRYRHELMKHMLAIFGSLVVAALISRKLAWVSLTFSGLRLTQLYITMVHEVDEELARRTDRLSSLCVNVRDHLRENVKKYFAIGAALATLYQGYQIIRPLLAVQDKSSYFDKSVDMFENILQHPKNDNHRTQFNDEKDYKEGYSRLTPKETKLSKTTTSADLQLAVAKALRFVVIKTKGEIYGTVNGIMVASNVILIPSHVVPDTFPFDIETSTTPGVPSAKTKDQRLTEDYCYIDREKDYAMIHLASSPASNDFSQFFPEEYPEFRTRATKVLWKSPENKVITSEQPARQLVADLDYYGYLEKPGRLYGVRQELHKYTLKKGTGLKVDLDFDGFGGLCGGLYLDASKGIIYGFHVAGYIKSCTGYLTCITQPLLKKGMQKLEQTSPTLLVHNASEVRVDTYDLPYTVVNEKPLYTREDGTKDKTIVTYIGKVLKEGQPMESRARSPYVPTPFVGVKLNLGEKRHMPPRKPNDIEKSMKTLNKLTNPVQHYEGDTLKRAIDDFKEHTLTAVRDNMDDCKEMLRLYTQEEALDGIGEFGLGGCPNDTSAGFPINKTKKQCLERDPMDESLVMVPRKLTDKYDIQGEIDRTDKAWLAGQRSEAIYKASSKVNELLPIEKAMDRVRKFYGSGFANFISSRKALAGVPRFMRKYWRTTECLVGINPTSKEWDDFHDYLTKYSSTHMIAGDFSGFDTRMAAQITAGAARIMLSWYEEVGCTEQELTYIRGALSDIVHPNILFEGDLYRFANGNPSGNLITVQLNSICNSIMMRYVYYSMMPSVKETFAENVRLGTYGDDNAMSVKHHCKWFNHTSCQKEFAKLDIGYTMADKDAKSVPYISINEISFLKRSFVRHETLDRIVAPIEEDSILKKFHWVKKPNESPLSPAEQFGAYTDGAFREAYLHGREYYDDFCMKIGAIVDSNPELKPQVAFIPYAEMTQILNPYYHETYVNDDSKLFTESFGVPEDDMGCTEAQFECYFD